VSSLSVRWSEHEARKPYARPFGVSFSDDSGSPLGGIAVSGADLLYYRQFKSAVLALAGELFADSSIDGAADQQRAWLDRVGGLIPRVGELRVRPQSAFDHEQGRTFRFAVEREGSVVATIDAPTLLEYQEFQAAVAHQAGVLYRLAEVENVPDPGHRAVTWERALRRIVTRPEASDAMAETWPWR
jgi:hypothetical protein